MSAVQALADTLERTVSDPELCKAGIEFPRLYIKIHEIEIPGEGFHLRLRKPLTLRLVHELAYWLVTDNKTLVWGTDVTPGAAVLDYMREWRDRLQRLEEHRDELGRGLLAELNRLHRLIA